MNGKHGSGKPKGNPIAPSGFNELLHGSNPSYYEAGPSVVRVSESSRHTSRKAASSSLVASPYQAGSDTLYNQQGSSSKAYGSGGLVGGKGGAGRGIRHHPHTPAVVPSFAKNSVESSSFYSNGAHASTPHAPANGAYKKQPVYTDSLRDQTTLSSFARPQGADVKRIKGAASQPKESISIAGRSKTGSSAARQPPRATGHGQVIDLESDDDGPQKPLEADDPIEDFADELGNAPRKPEKRENSAQKVVPPGRVAERTAEIASRAKGSHIHAQPAMNATADSEDELLCVSSTKVEKPKRVAAMQSKAEAASASRQMTNGRGNIRAATALVSLPVAAFNFGHKAVKNTLLVLDPSSRNSTEWRINFKASELSQLSFSPKDVAIAKVSTTPKLNPFFVLTLAPVAKMAKNMQDPIVIIEFDTTHQDWTGSQDVYERLVAAFKACLSDVEYLAFPDFRRIREAVIGEALTHRESRTRGTTSTSAKAAEAAEKRLKQESAMKSLAPKENTEKPPPIRPRPTDRALAADSRRAATFEGRGNGPTPPFVSTSGRRASVEPRSTTEPKSKSKKTRARSLSSDDGILVDATRPRERKERKRSTGSLEDEAPSATDKGKGRARPFEDLPRQENAFERFFPEDKTALVYPFDATGSVTITNGDLNRLAPGEYLNDTLIEYGMKRLCAELETSDNELFQQVHVFSSFFYKKLTEKEGRNKGNPYESVKKWTSKFNLFHKKYIILPINENFHWYLAIIVNPGWVIDPRAAERKAQEIKRNQSRKSKQTARKSTGVRKKRVIEQSDDENRRSDNKASHDVLRRASQSRSPEPPPLPSRDLSPAILSEDEVQASDKPDSKAGSVSTEDSAMQRMSDIANGPTKDKAPNSASSDEMDIDTPIAATAAIAENTAIQVSPNDRCYIITFDSLGGSHSSVYSTLKNYLKCEAKDKLNLEDDAVHIDKENCKGSSAKVPEQPNGCDCGLYVLHFAEMFLRKASDIMQCFEKERRLAQTQDEVDTMWDSVRALQGRTKLLQDIREMSAKWEAFVIDRDIKQKEAREARRKAKAARAARASDTEMQDPDTAMSGVPESESSSGSEESADDDIEMVTVKRASPRKRIKDAPPTSSQGENANSQSTIKASAARVRSTSPGFTVTTQRAESPDTVKRQKPTSHRVEIPSSTAKKPTFVGVEVPSKRSAGPLAPRPTSQANEQPEKTIPTPHIVRDMEIDRSPSVDIATAHVNGQTDKAFDAADIEESEEYATESSDSSDNSVPGAARLPEAEHDMGKQFVPSNTNTKGLTRQLGHMHVEQQRQEAALGSALESSVPLTDHNSRPQKPDEGDDSFAFRSVKGHDSLANMPNEELFAHIRDQVAAGDGSSQQSVDFEGLRTDPRKYKAPINHGDQPLPESPARQGHSCMLSSPTGLIGDEVTGSPNIFGKPGQSQATTSKSGDDAGPSKRKRHSSTVTSPSHSQEGIHPHKAKKPRSVPSLGTAQAPAPENGQKVNKMPSTRQIIEITDDDPEMSTELAAGDRTEKTGLDETSIPPFPAQYVASRSSASQSPKQKHREKPAQSGHWVSGSRSSHF